LLPSLWCRHYGPGARCWRRFAGRQCHRILHDVRPAVFANCRNGRNPATCARSVCIKRPERFSHRSTNVRRFILTTQGHLSGRPPPPRWTRSQYPFHRIFPPQQPRPGESKPITPNQRHRRFSSPSDRFTLRPEDSSAPACIRAAKLKRSFSVTAIFQKVFLPASQ
jgi:hypothetical protein